jgi:hypothetical protein
MRATCPAHFTLLDLITLKILILRRVFRPKREKETKEAKENCIPRRLYVLFTILLVLSSRGGWDGKYI